MGPLESHTREGRQRAGKWIPSTSQRPKHPSVTSAVLGAEDTAKAQLRWGGSQEAHNLPRKPHASREYGVVTTAMENDKSG